MLPVGPACQCIASYKLRQCCPSGFGQPSYKSLKWLTCRMEDISAGYSGLFSCQETRRQGTRRSPGWTGLKHGAYRAGTAVPYGSYQQAHRAALRTPCSGLPTSPGLSEGRGRPRWGGGGGANWLSITCELRGLPERMIADAATSARQHCCIFSFWGSHAFGVLGSFDQLR